jgi:chromate reductase, NAD(P)H dehydrogenase (quinone)
VQILAICGSLQENSGNLTLLKCAMAQAPEGVAVVLFDGIRELPQFNPDLESNTELPVVAAWRHALRDSAAVLIASPEYGFSLPGALKNAIDWVIGTGELESKIVAITAAVPGPERGRRGLGALRDTLNAVSAKIVGGEPIARGPGFEGAVLELLMTLVAAVNES